LRVAAAAMPYLPASALCGTCGTAVATLANMARARTAAYGTLWNSEGTVRRRLFLVPSLFYSSSALPLSPSPPFSAIHHCGALPTSLLCLSLLTPVVFGIGAGVVGGTAPLSTGSYAALLAALTALLAHATCALENAATAVPHRIAFALKRMRRGKRRVRQAAVAAGAALALGDVYSPLSLPLRFTLAPCCTLLSCLQHCRQPEGAAALRALRTETGGRRMLQRIYGISAARAAGAAAPYRGGVRQHA